MHDRHQTKVGVAAPQDEESQIDVLRHVSLLSSERTVVMLRTPLPVCTTVGKIRAGGESLIHNELQLSTNWRNIQISNLISNKR